MRLWSLHPQYLDSKGLVALWRETLLAKQVLQGKTKGYRNHPQLKRFKEHQHPLGAICQYLETIAREADVRNYNFDKGKIGKIKTTNKILVNSGQLTYEYKHLLQKLKKRDKVLFEKIKKIKRIKTNPIFQSHKGKIENWEIL